MYGYSLQNTTTFYNSNIFNILIKFYIFVKYIYISLAHIHMYTMFSRLPCTYNINVTHYCMHKHTTNQLKKTLWIIKFSSSFDISTPINQLKFDGVLKLITHEYWKSRRAVNLLILCQFFSQTPIILLLKLFFFYFNFVKIFFMMIKF